MKPKLSNMKKLVLSLVILAGFAMQALAYDFQSGDLLYTIISTAPPCVRLDGHVDGTEAQGDLTIPEAVEYEGVTYTVTEIGGNAFNGCVGLTGRLEIPSTIKQIGKQAFRQCCGFSGDLVIPNSVSSLGSGAFQGCLNLDGQLVLSNSITTTPHYSFAGCSKLSGTLIIPNSVMDIRYGAFAECSGFTGDLIIPNTVAILGKGGEGLNGFYGTFQDCTGFDGCLVLPDSLKIIYSKCFDGCCNLTGSLLLPNGLEEICDYSFFNCRGFVGEVNLPVSLKKIGNCAFDGCSGFTGKLVFPDTLEWIGDEAFAWCSFFTDVEFRHHVFYENNYGGEVFKGWSFVELDIPEGWTTIHMGTFKSCKDLTVVHFPESLTDIDNYAFDNCNQLCEIDFPENLQTIGCGAFRCKNLRKIHLPHSLTEIRGWAFDRSGLMGDVVIPDQVGRVETRTFDSCVYIKRIVLGKNVNCIYDDAFKNTQLESMIIKAVVPPELKFYSTPIHIPTDLPVTVPCGTLETYQNTEGWHEFTNIREGVTDIISVSSSNESVGIASIPKEATCEDRTVEVEAIPNEGCAFMYWVANGEQVSSENPYGFMLEEDTELVAYFSGTGVDEKEQMFIVYPNPARETVTIEGIEVAEVQVYNALGQLVKTVRGTNEINVGDLPEGMYLLRITDKEGVSFVKRITINK